MKFLWLTQSLLFSCIMQYGHAISEKQQRSLTNLDDTYDPDNHEAVLNEKKTLVLFAGPHSSASTSVEEFFHKWAENGWMKGKYNHIAFDGLMIRVREERFGFFWVTYKPSFSLKQINKKKRSSSHYPIKILAVATYSRQVWKS